MASKKPDLDDATVRILKRVLAMPPKHHDDMKVGRPKSKKRAAPKGRAASAKPRNASKTAGES
ncbi:hypothetical protein [Reyranella sp.]|uniref:hypothetical protein n=1 Tax=Reyranella sp. TaxID=1929291 RepID=UPI003BAC2999